MDRTYDDYKKLVDEHLLDFLPNVDNKSISLYESMKYSLTAGGKRLRPVLLLAACEFAGGNVYDAIPYACALEYIHTYSLIHDDLPAIDNDEYRRGKKTTHAVYGEALGVLSGDALLNYAYETACIAFSMDADTANVGKAMTILTRKTGMYGMLGGQSVDVTNEGKEISREMLDYIYENKTSALIEGSMMVGAVLAGATSEELGIIEQIGKKVGQAFQIRDDILDVTSTMEELGKPVFSDEKNHKVTYVTLRGLEQATKDVEEISEEAIRLLQGFSQQNPFLQELVRSLVNRKN